MPHRRVARAYTAWNRGLNPDQRSSVRTAWVALPFLLIGVTAIGLLLYSFTQPLRIEAPFVFSQPSYTPLHRTTYCPGETIEWPVAFAIRRAPVMVISVRSIWDVENNQTVTLQGPSAVGALAFTNYTETTSVSRTAKLVLPDLVPGEYQIRSAAQEFNSQAAAYQVPFQIKERCPPVEVK